MVPAIIQSKGLKGIYRSVYQLYPFPLGYNIFFNFCKGYIFVLGQSISQQIDDVLQKDGMKFNEQSVSSLSLP